MAAITIDQIYEQQIKPLTRADRLRLLARIADDLAVADERDRSALTILAQASGGRAFRSADEVAAYLNEERATWDR